MYRDVLPDIANLYCAAGSILFRGVDVSATGLGDSIDEAETLRNAEFAERKSFILGPQDRCMKPAHDLDQAMWTIDAGIPPAGQEIACLSVRDLATGGRSWIPEHMISGHGRPTALMAEGTAAGHNAEMAILNAVREALERYASSHWWQGQRVPSQPSALASMKFDELQQHWSRRHKRRAGLLNITPGFGVPVFVAWSCREDGRGLCFGMACHPRQEEAVKAALKELLQMEFGLDVIEYRQRNGVSLGMREQVMLARANRLKFDDCAALLTPGPEPGRVVMEADDHLTSARLATHLSRFGISFHVIDLPPTDAVHRVVHVLSPDLRLPERSAAARHGSTGWTRWDLY